MTYDITNPVYSNPENTAIDLTWNHPEFGPIPFTLIESEYPDMWAQVHAEFDLNPV